jgi:hypothetical protein
MNTTPIPEPNFINIALTVFAIVGGSVGLAFAVVFTMDKRGDRMNKQVALMGMVLAAVAFITYHFVWGWN